MLTLLLSQNQTHPIFYRLSACDGKRTHYCNRNKSKQLLQLDASAKKYLKPTLYKNNNYDSMVKYERI